MILYSSYDGLECHRIRMMLAEKEIDANLIFVGDKEVNPDLQEINPYNSVPTLAERNVSLYEPHVIMEYLEERFPYPPLMPTDPIGRANLRLNMHHIEKTWFPPIQRLLSKDKRQDKAATKQLEEVFERSANIFSKAQFFMHDEFSSLDCCVVPILWRVHAMKLIDLNKYKPIAKYAGRMFERGGFTRSLTEAERELVL